VKGGRGQGIGEKGMGIVRTVIVVIIFSRPRFQARKKK